MHKIQPPNPTRDSPTPAEGWNLEEIDKQKRCHCYMGEDLARVSLIKVYAEILQHKPNVPNQTKGHLGGCHIIQQRVTEPKC